MAYITVPESVLAVDDPIRSTDIIQLDRNIEDLNSRLSSIEPGGFYSHFTDNNMAADAQPWRREGIYVSTSAGAITSRIAGTTDAHTARVTTGIAGTLNIAGIPAFHFTNRVKPLTYTTRIQYDTRGNIAFLCVGWQGEALAAGARPNNGIFLELGGAANTFRFTSRRNGGASPADMTFGADFAWIANATWFTVSIVFTDAGGNRALCYVDGVLKETITLTLPTAKNLYGNIGVTAVGGASVQIDADMAFGSAGGGVVNQ